VNRLDAWPWTEVARHAGPEAVLLVPLGSTEQHGPHLPVTTDTDIATALAEGAAAHDGRLIVAPPLSYGSSGEHRGFAGTLSIGLEATELMLVELGRSASLDFGHVVVVSAHGGNAVAVSRAMERLAGEGRPVVAWSPRWRGDAHAGRTETSLMLAIAPERVRVDAAEAGDRRSLAELLPRLQHGGVRSVSANGVLGDPTGAHAAEGRQLLAAAVAELLQLVGGHSELEDVEVMP
jgi:mycofactocin system creatininase family protein